MELRRKHNSMVVLLDREDWSQGVSVAYESKPTVRFVKLAIAAVFSLTASVVGALLVALLTPSNLQQLAAGLFSGTVGGSLFGTLSR